MCGQSRGVLAAGATRLLMSLLQLRMGGVAPLPSSAFRVVVIAIRGVWQMGFLKLGSLGTQ